MRRADADDGVDAVDLIRESTLAVTAGDLKRIRALRFTTPGFDRSVWQTMGEMGWLGLRLPASMGGSGLRMKEYCALAEQLGRALVPEPLIPGVLAASLLPPSLLPRVLSGDRIVLPAWQEKPNSLDFTGSTTFRNGKVNGRKVLIPMAAGADQFLVSTRDGLVLVDRDAGGVTCSAATTQDGGHYGTVVFDDCPAVAAAGNERHGPAALDEAILATAAYLLGVMEHAFEIALEYVKTRAQFGRKLSGFQALQHRAVDLKIQISLSRASIDSAAALLASDAGPDAKSMAVSRAKARAADAALLVARQSVQLHGAIGYTDEADPGLFLRKAMVIGNLFGSAALHRKRYASLAPELDID